MKVLVTGSRSWTDREAVRRELQKLPPGTVVVHGAATGADSIAHDIALDLGFTVRTYPANWEELGNKAGPIRNSDMLRKEHRSGDPIDFGLAFTSDLERSRGTKDMVTKARTKGIRMEIHSS